MSEEVKSKLMRITRSQLNPIGQLVSMFLEEYNDMYLFKNIHGEFAVTKKKIDNHEISLELIED